MCAWPGSISRLPTPELRLQKRTRSRRSRSRGNPVNRYCKWSNQLSRGSASKETLTAARENYIQSLYSFNVAKIAVARGWVSLNNTFNFFGGK